MKLLGYAPDLDPLTDGILLECDHVVPTYRGIGSAPSAVAAEITANAASAAIGAATLIKINGDARTFFGSDTKLYEEASKAWSDVSGGTYTTVTDRWRFAQYGDVSLAVSKENVLQASSSGAFATVTSTATGSTVTAPSASVIEVVNDFIFLGDTTGVPGFTSDTGDRWVCSALGDYQNFTPDTSTQCVTGRLTSTPGKIKAMKKFGDQIVVYKERGMYLGSYVGPPVIWGFPEIPTANQGTWCQESVIALGTPEQPLHFFVGRDDFYLFDGARPTAIGHGVKERFFGELNLDAAEQICMVLDRQNTRVLIHYPKSPSTTNNACLVFNYRTRKWGVDTRDIEFAFEYIGGSVSYSGLGAYLTTLLGATATYGSDIPLPYGGLVPQGNNFVPAIFNTSHVLLTLTGEGGMSTFTPSIIGTDDFTSRVQRVAPRWLTRPSDASMTNYYWMVSGDTPTLDTTSQMESGRFDILRSASWHKFSFELTGNWETNAMKIDAVQDGAE